MFLEFRILRPQASAQRPDWPAQEVSKLGSFKARTTVNGVGGAGFG
jgi:hypothetical protein